MNRKSPPNILLIMTDQQRFDAVGVNGDRPVRTPHLDALAAAGARFTNAYINSPVCIPSRACVHTGRYTHQHGVRYTDTQIHESPGLPRWETTVMERLQAAMYDTGGVGKIDMYPTRGFDTVHLTRGKGNRWTVPYGSPLGPSLLGDAYAGWLEERHPGGYEKIYAQRREPEYKARRGSIVNVLPHDQHVDYWIAENAVNFIREPRDRPFFLACSFTSPHGPFDPPARYADMYPIDEMPLPHLYESRPDPSSGPAEGDLKRTIAYYYALCTFIDDLVGMIVQGLKDEGVYDDTLIIFTSDHGEMLGEFGLSGKSKFYESVIRVPLIVKPPGAAQGGRVVEEMVEHIDIAPTMLDFAGLRIPDSVQGESWRPLLSKGSGGKDAVLCELTTENQTAHGKCLRTKEWKYVYWSAPEGSKHPRGAELYDLVNDPDERYNLAGDARYQDMRITMHEHLLDHLLGSERPITD